MSQCRTPYATGAGQFPPMKRCASKSHLPKGPCREHEAQLALFDQPGNSGLKNRYRALVTAFEAWELAIKETRGQSGESLRVRDRARDLIAVARGH
jgi:hypothetical protein